MRKSLSPLAVASLSTALLMTGCDQQAVQQSDAQQSLDQAIQVIDVANQGYVPESDADEYDRLDAFRQDKLSQAVDPLESVRNSGTADQKKIAAQLLSDIRASAARHQLQQAMAQFASIRSQNSKLLGLVDSAARAASAVRDYQRDPDALAGPLEAQAQKQQQQAQQLSKQVNQRQQEIQSAQAKVKQASDQSDEHFTQAQKLRDQAFVAKGDKHYDLAQQAIKADSAGQASSVQAEQTKVHLDDLQLRLAPDQARLEMLRKSAQQLKQQAQAARADAKAAQPKLSEAQQRQSDVVGKLGEQFDQATAAFKQQVRQPLQAASDQMASAVQVLQQASDNGSDVGDDLLTRRVEQAYLLTQRAVALKGFATTLQAVAGGAQRLNLDRAQAFAQARQDIAQAHDQVVSQAQKAIQAGQALANGMGDAASSRGQQLSQYQQQLQGGGVGTNTDSNSGSGTDAGGQPTDQGQNNDNTDAQPAG